MKPERAIVAERALARHAPEMFGREPGADEIQALFARAGQRLSRALAPMLAAMCGGEAPAIAVRTHEWSAGELSRQSGPLSASCLFDTAIAGVQLLASIDGAGVLRLVDRVFGGKGAAPEVMPAELPMSAELTVERLEAILGRALAEAFGDPADEPLRVSRRSGNLAELCPRPASTPLAVLVCDVDDRSGGAWPIVVGAPQSMLAKLLGQPARRMPPALRAADPAAAPFADVPFPLVATLVDMRVTLSAIAQIAPGVVLPVPVSRSVPLSIEGATIARGTVGAQDDRVALKLTQIA